MRSSSSHPLRIAGIVAPKAGMIGVTFCPGKYQPVSETGGWDRDLDVDLDAIRDWRAVAVVTLVTADELKCLRVESLGERVRDRGMRWFHLPIEDVSIPTVEWECAWKTSASAELHGLLDSDGRVLVHCKGGLGRAGLVAARLLIERGVPADEAIGSVRRQRPGAIETREQEEYLLALDGG